MEARKEEETASDNVDQADHLCVHFAQSMRFKLDLSAMTTTSETWKSMTLSKNIYAKLGAPLAIRSHKPVTL